MDMQLLQQHLLKVYLYFTELLFLPCLNQFGIVVWASFCLLSLVLIHVSALLSSYPSLIRYILKQSRFFFLFFPYFFKIWLCTITFVFSCKFQNNIVYIYTNFAGILVGITLNLYTNLGRIDIFTTLSLPMHKHGMSLYLFRSSLIFSQHYVVFNYKFCIYFVTLISKYFIFSE